MWVRTDVCEPVVPNLVSFVDVVGRYTSSPASPCSPEVSEQVCILALTLAVFIAQP